MGTTHKKGKTNRARKLLAPLLAFVFSLAACVSAFAAETGSITITNPEKGHTYSVYRLFDSVYYEEEGGVAYWANGEQKDFYESLEGNPFRFTWISDQSAYKVNTRIDTDVSESDVTGFIRGLAADGAIGEMVDAGLASLEAEAVAGEGELTFSGLPYGYYFVTSTMGSLVSIDTAVPDAEMEEKNEAPSVTKSVANSALVYSSSVMQRKGKSVYFRVTVTAYPGASGYVLHDTMDDAFKLDEESFTVTADGIVLTEGEEYTITLPDNGIDDGCSFEIVFSEDWLLTIASETEIVVDYSALVTSSAVNGLANNHNTAYLSYGEDSRWTTDEAEASVTAISALSSTGGSSSGSSSGSGYSFGTTSASAGTEEEDNGYGPGYDTDWEPVSIPQTGQLNWPVPVLAVIGMVLMIMGYVVDEKEKRNKENSR